MSCGFDYLPYYGYDYVPRWWNEETAYGAWEPYATADPRDRASETGLDHPTPEI